jgi:hypothetical protein
MQFVFLFRGPLRGLVHRAGKEQSNRSEHLLLVLRLERAQAWALLSWKQGATR